MDQQDNKQNTPKKTVKVLLIRHAESQFNLGQRVARNSETEVHGKDECLVTKFSEEFVDCSITEQGYKQCAKAREICKNEDVGLVFVSPLRRALETCKEIFHGHSSNPRIVPNPLFREMLLSNCDIGAKILESKQLYPEDDFSFLDQIKYPNLWSLYHLLDKERSDEVISKIEELCGNDEQEVLKNGHLKLLEIIKQLHPESIESQKEQFVRTQQQKDLIKEASKSLPEGKKIAVVGHSRTLHFFTTVICPETGKETESKWFDNGEVFEYEILLD